MVFRLFTHAVERAKAKSNAKSQIGLGVDNIGAILFRKGVISQRQLEAAVETQNARRSNSESKLATRLGDILVSMGCCTREELDSSLGEQHRAHLPDSKKTHDAFDALDKVLSKAEARGEEMKKANQDMKRETLTMSVSDLKVAG